MILSNISSSFEATSLIFIHVLFIVFRCAMKVKMMKKFVDNFVHRPGVHCESSALRDILDFNGFPFSESMIFGLGGGLGFIYWRGEPMPYPFVGGRAKDFDKTLCANLGVATKVNKTSSKTRAYKALKELIAKDVPVMVHVDMPFLKYLSMPEEAHFGAHVVVVAGIDEDEDVVYIADTQFEKLQTATLEELEHARASKFKPFPPENKWFTFEFPSKLTTLEKAIKEGISKTITTMLEPPIQNLGIRGIRHFADEIGEWPKEYPPERPLFTQLYEVTYVMLEKDGTGGGCFRNLYSRFLREAGEYLSTRKLTDLGERYNRIGEKWTKVAYQIRGIPINEGNVVEIKKNLSEIADDEEKVLLNLKTLL